MDLREAEKKFLAKKDFKNAFECIKNLYPDDYDLLVEFRNELTKAIREGKSEELNLLKSAYKISAKEHFEDYCIYTEWDKDDKFYTPRRKGLKRVVDALQRLADDKTDILCISMPPGTGKALADDTPILTRKGWKKHGDLVVGDEVIGMDGKFKKVIRVLPKCQLDRLVEFTNGEKIVCHERHEWLFYDRCSGKESLKETKEWEKRKLDNDIEGRGHRYMLQLPFVDYIEGEEKDLPCEPYSLGVWLGDGTNRQPVICSAKADEIVLKKVADIYGLRRRFIHKTTGVIYYKYDKLRPVLRKCGMCVDTRRTDKHIPEEYLTASISQRLKLLAGLLDTDGTLNGNKYAFSTAEDSLKEDFIKLVSTFGWRCCVTHFEPSVSSSGIDGKKGYWKIQFTPDLQIPCILVRKQNNGKVVRRRLAVKSITKTEPKQGNCITVEGGMYLAGKTMLPTHNTGIAIYFLTWLAGRNPKDAILGGSHNAAFLRGVYDECLREMNTEEYKWAEVFKRRVVRTNAQDMKIDVTEPQRFSTLQFSSVGSGNAGKVRSIQLLYCDDLVEGIEEAMSPERLDKKWQLYTTDLRQRKQGNCKELHIATRWSVHDVIGRIQEANENNPRAEFLSMPALNDKGESNFDYGGSNGFTKEFYEDMRRTMDDASFKALYMNEPIEREGLLYQRKELRRFYELPDYEPDGIIAVCDTAEGGGDDTVMPIGYIYGNDHYIYDCVCDDGLPEVTDVMCADALTRNKVKMCQFESNAAGGRTADKINDLVKEKGWKCSITKKRTTANKQTKIIVNSAWVKEHCLFLDDSLIQPKTAYDRFMNKLCTFSLKGKNKHDDVPDAMAQYSLFAENLGAATIVVGKRTF